MTTFYWILIFAISSALINTVGIFAIYKKKKWADRVKTYLMCFAAGILISTPLISSLPNAVAKNEYAGYAALTGFLFMLFSNSLIKKKTKEKSLAFGIIAIEGIGIHSFVDGAIYAIAFSTSITVGFLASIGLVIHEFAEGVITFSVLIKGGMKAERSAIYAFFVAALTTPIGALLVYPFIKDLNKSILGILLGFVSGVLIYISASHLLPEARKQEKEHSILAFLMGICLAFLIVFAK